MGKKIGPIAVTLAMGAYLGGLPAQTDNTADKTTEIVPTRSVWDGVYTEEQAKRGEPLYYRECSTCHGETLEGKEETPTLVGPDFVSDWNGLALNKLFDKIRLTMPKDDPGQVGIQQKADILAYVLSVNKFPAGKKELPLKSEELKEIRFDGKKPESKNETAGK
jgi:cytochrome c